LIKHLRSSAVDHLVITRDVLGNHIVSSPQQRQLSGRSKPLGIGFLVFGCGWVQEYGGMSSQFPLNSRSRLRVLAYWHLPHPAIESDDTLDIHNLTPSALRRTRREWHRASSCGQCQDQGLREAIGFPWQAPRLLGRICRAMARLTLDDSLSAFDLPGVPGSRSSIICCNVAFFTSATSHFIPGWLQIPQCRHSSSQFRPPGGLGDEMLGQGCGDAF
jgi:hypothetical protein